MVQIAVAPVTAYLFCSVPRFLAKRRGQDENGTLM